MKVPVEVTRKICVDYTATGIETMGKLARSASAKPLRFIYTSGFSAERDSAKKPWLMGGYSLIRVRPLSPIWFMKAFADAHLGRGRIQGLGLCKGVEWCCGRMHRETRNYRCSRQDGTSIEGFPCYSSRSCSSCH